MGGGRKREGRGGKVLRLMVLIGTVGLWHHNDVGLLTLFYAAKKDGKLVITTCI